MKDFSARRLRLVPACIISAATVAALLTPGAADASLGTQCSGANVIGQGASVEKIEQISIWTGGFNTSTDKYACNGKQGTKAKPTITYTSSSSGAGLKSWGAEPKSPSEVTFAASNAYIGSSEAPTAAQIADIEGESTSPSTPTLETIPVSQFALAIYVNLPSGCTATSTADPGRLVLNNSTLAKIYAGEDKTWGQITDDGDALTPAGCDADAITPIVREDQAGTTHVLKRYLGLVNSGSFADESGGSHTWNELSDGALNTDWPTATKVTKTPSSGDGEEAALVGKTPGSIGYSNLAELRSTNLFSGTGNGPGTAKFWVPIQHSEKISGSGAKEKVKYTYEDPASNGDVEAAASANCKSTVYTNGKGTEFPPESVLDPWNEVTTELAEKKYTLCGFTYVLALSSYSEYPGTSLNEATTVSNYLQYITDSKGGQKAVEGHDYLALPKGTVVDEAQEGAADIGF